MSKIISKTKGLLWNPFWIILGQVHLIEIREIRDFTGVYNRLLVKETRRNMRFVGWGTQMGFNTAQKQPLSPTKPPCKAPSNPERRKWLNLFVMFWTRISQWGGFCCILGFSSRSVPISRSIRFVGVSKAFRFDLKIIQDHEQDSRSRFDPFPLKSALSSPVPT